jgi:pimeloyl-ACP methyl ester carboxylesterase
MQYLEDVKTVINHMNENGEYKKILVGGHSRGGRISVLYAARDPRVSFVLGVMPSSREADKDKKEEWRKAGIKISRRELPDCKEKIKEFRLPFSHVLDLEKYNTFAEAGKIKNKVILIAGELDDLVLPEEVKELSEKIVSEKRFVIIPNIGHDYRKNDEEIEIINGIIANQLDSIGA